jgi:Surface antigen variable number repeat
MPSFKPLALICALSAAGVGLGAAEATLAAAPVAPVIMDSLSYAGNSEISTSELTQDSPLKPGMVISDDTIRGEVNRIIAVYRAHGFDLALMPDVQHPSAGHVVVTIRINEQGTSGTAVPVQATGEAPPAGVAPNGPAPAQ